MPYNNPLSPLRFYRYVIYLKISLCSQLKVWNYNSQQGGWQNCTCTLMCVWVPSGPCESMYVGMFVCMYVCMYASMYVCVDVCVSAFRFLWIHTRGMGRCESRALLFTYMIRFAWGHYVWKIIWYSYCKNQNFIAPIQLKQGWKIM